MASTGVHPRVCLRHPELSEDDVLAAWKGVIASSPRLQKDRDEYVAVGFDGNGRLLEMVAVRGVNGHWLIYHAMTPPSARTLGELGMGR